MSDVRDLLERADRATQRILPPRDRYERLLRLRDRRRRNQRIASAVLALILALAVLGGTISVFQRGEGLRPASQPITPTNIGSLRLLGTGSFGGHADGVSVSDGLAYVTTRASSGELVAFPASCASPDACAPVWIADTHGGTPAAGDGMVYVASDNLYAFSASCGSGGATCEPAWIGSVSGRRMSAPVLGTDAVYVAGAGERGGTLYSFPTSCRSKGGTCEPNWSATFPSSWYPRLKVTDDTLYVVDSGGRYAAFPTDCGTSGAMCDPLKGAPAPPQPVVDGKVFVGTDPGQVVRAYSAQCADLTCPPLWHTSGITSTRWGMITPGNGLLFVFQWHGGSAAQGPGRSGGGILAYPTECGTGNATCDPAWTWGTGTAGEQHVSIDALATAGDRLYAASGNGKLYVFGPGSRPSVAAVPVHRSSRGGEIVFYASLAALAAILLLVRARRRRTARLNGTGKPDA